jgi:hypothetical protein
MRRLGGAAVNGGSTRARRPSASLCVGYAVFARAWGAGTVAGVGRVLWARPTGDNFIS